MSPITTQCSWTSTTGPSLSPWSLSTAPLLPHLQTTPWIGRPWASSTEEVLSINTVNPWTWMWTWRNHCNILQQWTKSHLLGRSFVQRKLITSQLRMHTRGGMCDETRGIATMWFPYLFLCHRRPDFLTIWNQWKVFDPPVYGSKVYKKVSFVHSGLIVYLSFPSKHVSTGANMALVSPQAHIVVSFGV